MKAIMSYHAYQRCLERDIDAAAVVARVEATPLFPDMVQILHMGAVRVVLMPNKYPEGLRIKTVYVDDDTDKGKGFLFKRRRYLRDR